MSRPKVSIIVPCYNHRRFIRTLIESIYSQIFKDFELIVLDDGSKDGSGELLIELSKKYGFKLVLKENEGLCKTLNKGIGLASGDFFTAIASDDFIPRYRLQQQVDFLESNPEVDVVAGGMEVVDIFNQPCGKRIPSLLGEISFDQMLKINRVMAATAMIRKNVFTNYGLYREDHVFEDYFMWLNILKNGGKIFNTDKIWAFYRVDNRELEKKIHWYYKGVTQALDEFQDEPLVSEYQYSHRLRYLLKLTLLKGRKVLKENSEYLKLDSKGKVVINVVSFVPYLIRNSALKMLKLKS